MSDFDSKLQCLKEFLIDILKPSIREYLHYHNPKAVIKWNWNCCQQISLIGNRVLQEILLGNSSGYYEIQSWYGLFVNMEDGNQVEYNHSWIYCLHQGCKKNLFIDIAHTSKPSLFVYTDQNQHPRSIKGYEHLLCLQKERLDEKTLWRQKEYFTNKTVGEMMPKLLAYVKKQSLMKMKKGKALSEHNDLLKVY